MLPDNVSLLEHKLKLQSIANPQVVCHQYASHSCSCTCNGQLAVYVYLWPKIMHANPAQSMISAAEVALTPPGHMMEAE